MEEVKPQEQENIVPATKEATAPVAEAINSEPETEQQINWRKFREAREKDRKDKIEAEKKAAEKEAEVQALKAAMEAIVNKPVSNPHQIQDNFDESEDQRIARLIEERLEKERQKRQIEEQEREKKAFPQKLTKEYPDFDQVCNSENLDYFEFHYPEVAEAFKHMPDGYDKWSRVYQAVKRFVPNKETKQNQAMAEKNMAKPQAMSISGKTPTGDSAPQYLDEKRKADNWQRMLKTMRGG